MHVLASIEVRSQAGGSTHAPARIAYNTLSVRFSRPTANAAPAMEDIFNSDVHSAIHGEDGKISFVINPSAEDEQFDFGSPSLWGTDQDKSEKPSSKSIINGDDLMAQQEISKLRKSKVEKNRAYLEQNIPYGEESRFFSLFSCLSCALLGRALPEDLERALLNKKVRTDLAGALVPVLLDDDSGRVADDARRASRSARRTKPHTNTQPTAHSQRPARHLHRDPPVRIRNGRFSLNFS